MAKNLAKTDKFAGKPDEFARESKKNTMELVEFTFYNSVWVILRKRGKVPKSVVFHNTIVFLAIGKKEYILKASSMLL